MQVTVSAYCGNEDPMNPLISPLFADYRDMPPIQIQVASEETIYDDSSRLYEKLKVENPGKVEFIEWKGLFHVFQAFCLGWGSTAQDLLMCFLHKEDDDETQSTTPTKSKNTPKRKPSKRKPPLKVPNKLII